MSSQSHSHPRGSHDHEAPRRTGASGAGHGEPRPRRPFEPDAVQPPPAAVSQADGDA